MRCLCSYGFYVMVIRIVIVEASKRVCEFYNPSECAVITDCNQTQICSENGDDNERWHCYALWTNASGSPVILMKGCWLNQEYCYNRQRCKVTEVNKDNNFCCCDEDLCNMNIDMETSSPQFEKLITTTSGLNQQNSNAEMVKKTLLMSLCPLLILTLIIIIAFYAWRRCAFKVSGYKAPSFQAIMIGDKVPITGGSGVELLEVIASGCFGPIWKGKVDGKDVAVKMISKSGERMWLAENEFYAAIDGARHDHILTFVGSEVRQVHEYEKHVCPEFWLMTEYHQRGSLFDNIKVRVLSLQDIIQIAFTTSRGLAFLHSSSNIPRKTPVAHRDLKSRNILLKEDFSACISDFGLSLIWKQNLNNVHGQVGSVRYMAPEVLDGAINSNIESFLKIDVYSCSLVFWELLSRCSECGTCGDYSMPFEEEVGQHPTIENMQNLVLNRKVRPILKKEWWDHEILKEMCRMIEDCWDHDAEARLMSDAIEQRMSRLHREVFSPNLS